MASIEAASGTVPTPEAEPAGLCISLLGTFAVWLGPHEIPAAMFPRRKSLRLLKLVALQPKYQLHRDQVLDLLWPNLAPRSATAQLYKAIYHVRTAFAGADPAVPVDTLFELSDEMVRLRAPGGVHTDVTTFEQLAAEALHSRELSILQRAIACYTGDLLPADRYEEWTISRRDRLQALLLDLLVAVGRRYLDSGYLAEAADAFRKVLARDETREDAHRTLMRIYALQGSRARALRQYRQCVEMLARELGVEPSQETIALHDAILQEQVQPAQVTPPLPALDLPLLSPLVGRQTERTFLRERLEQLEHGTGGVLALEGEAGIGKTRLAQELLQMGTQHGEVLWGGAYEQEGHSPYMPIIEALRTAVRLDPTDAHRIPAELAGAIPELPATAASVANPDWVAAQSALFAGMLRFLTARAQRAALVMILDDLHAADPGSLKLFHYLARHAESVPLLLVGIWRTDEPDDAGLLETIVGNLDREGLLHRLTLMPLSGEEHRALVEQTLDGGNIGERLANELYQLSAGNPLFAKAMTRQLAADRNIVLVHTTWHLTDDIVAEDDVAPALQIPPSVQALVSSRLATLSPAALRMLQFAAVVGRDIPVPLLEEWSNIGQHGALEPSFLDVLDDAVTAGLMQERGISYRFAHPIFRHVVYQQMSVVRRRALHRQVAVGLERTSHAHLADAPVEAVAFHYLRGGDVDRAVHYLVRAGDRAESVYDHDSAVHRYDEALSLLQERDPAGAAHLRADIHERIGDVRRAIGNVAGSLDAYLQALDALAPEMTPAGRDVRRNLHRKITSAAVLTPDIPTAAEHLQQAWALLGDEPLERARLLITQALFDWHANQMEVAVEHASEALRIAEQAQASVEINQACEMLTMAYLPLGNWEEAYRYEVRRQSPVWSPETVVAVDAHMCLYQFRVQGAESFRQVKQFMDRVAEQATTRGNLRCLAVCRYAFGSLALLQGKLEIAAENLAQALVLQRRVGSSTGAAYTLGRQVELLTAAGKAEDGWKLVSAGLEMASQAAIRDHCIMLMHTAGIWNRLNVSDLDAAGELVQAAVEHDAVTGPCPICTVNRHVAMAAYYIAADDLPAATEYTDRALYLARFTHNRLGEARALRVQAMLDAVRDAIPEAETCLAEAAGIFRAVDDRYELAQTLHVWGDLPESSTVSPAERAATRRAAQELEAQFRTNISL